MRQRSLLTRGLLLAAAFVVASPAVAAVAAPARRQKPARAAKAKGAKPPPAEETPAPAEAKPEEPAPTPPPEEPKPVEAPVTAPVVETKVDLDAKPPSEPASAPEATSEEAALGRREAARIAAGRIAVAVSFDAGISRRSFTYSDPVGNQLAPYRLPVGPMASFGLEAYPFAATGISGLRDLGFRGRVSHAFAVDSKTPDGVTIDTSWTRFGGDIRQRFLVPGPHAFELGVLVGADASYFTMKTDAPVAALLPTGQTVALRFGFDTKLVLIGRFSAMLGGSYLAVTEPGEIYDRFRDATVKGVDSDFGFALGIVPGLEARLTGRYTRYFSTFKPALGDPNVAGGAVDEQMQFGLGARYAH